MSEDVVVEAFLHWVDQVALDDVDVNDVANRNGLKLVVDNQDVDDDLRCDEAIVSHPCCSPSCCRILPVDCRLWSSLGPLQGWAWRNSYSCAGPLLLLMWFVCCISLEDGCCSSCPSRCCRWHCWIHIVWSNLLFHVYWSNLLFHIFWSKLLCHIFWSNLLL